MSSISCARTAVLPRTAAECDFSQLECDLCSAPAATVLQSPPNGAVLATSPGCSVTFTDALAFPVVLALPRAPSLPYATGPNSYISNILTTVGRRGWGPLGLGIRTFPKLPKATPRKNKHFKEFHTVSSCSNSARKKTKKHSGMGATPSQSGDAQAGSRNFKAVPSVGHCETSRRYQQHFREACFPSARFPKKEKPSRMNQDISHEDLNGLKIAEAPIRRVQTADPSSSSSVAPCPHPKRARIALDYSLEQPPCRGMCPKVGWTMEQYCSYCHG